MRFSPLPASATAGRVWTLADEEKDNPWENLFDKLAKDAAAGPAAPAGLPPCLAATLLGVALAAVGLSAEQGKLRPAVRDLLRSQNFTPAA